MKKQGGGRQGGGKHGGGKQGPGGSKQGEGCYWKLMHEADSRKVLMYIPSRPIRKHGSYKSFPPPVLIGNLRMKEKIMDSRFSTCIIGFLQQPK
jgi:hypothetical protein